MRSYPQGWLAGILVAGSLGLLGPGPLARAQAVPASPAANLPTAQEFMPLADDSDLRADAEAARASEQEAGDALAVQRDLEADAKARLADRKTRLESLKKQIDLADKEKREADKKALEAERKNEEAARNFFERLVALRQAELEYLEAMKETHRARAAACDKELQLAAARRKQADTRSVTSSAQMSSLDTNRTSAEKLFLEATRTWTERAANAAGKNRTVAELRMQAWEALRNVRR